jgi:TP901 family phage tail tape measure protein
MSANAGTAYVDVRGDFSSLNRQLRQQASSQARPMRTLGANLGGSLAAGVTAGVKAGAVGVGAAMVYSLKKASDFEGQISSLGSVSDGSAKQMRALEKQALRAGAATKFSALEAARAQTELAKGGLSVAKIMRGGLKSALALAAAGEMDLADAAETTVNQMKLFGLRGKDAMKIADGLATAANSTTADVSHFALAFKQGGSAAKTAGLSFQETTTWLETLAEAGIKGSDAGTSMKTALIQLASPSSRKAAEMAKELGINVFDADGNMKSLVDVAGILQDKLGGLTRQQRIQASTTLVGQDGFRALLALYDAGPQKVARLQRELEKQGTAAEVAKKKQDNLKGSVEQMGGSFETLGIQIGTAAIPEVRELTDDVTGLANKIGQIVGRDDLSLGEKLNRIFKVTEVRAQPWVDKVEASIDRANLPERLGKLLTAAITYSASTAGPKAAQAFATSFVETNAWGRLLIGGWLLAKMGGPGAFRRVGAQAGAATAAGMAPAMATGMASGPLKGRMAGMLRGWGPTLGLALAATLGPEVGKALQQQSDKFKAGRTDAKTRSTIAPANGHLREEIALLDKRIASLRENDTATNRQRGRQKELRLELERTRDALKGKLAASDKAAASDQKALGMSNRFAQALRGLRLKGTGDFDQLVKSVTTGSRRILKVGGENSKQTRLEVSRQFGIARQRVKDAMDAKVVSVEEGTKRLRELARKELKLYGISAGKVDVVLAKGAGGEMRPHQRGAYISDGKPVGDSVPALLEKGEYVLNRKAVKKVGRHRLDALNFQSAPRFQQGGIVELLHPFNDPAGHGGSNSHLHIAMANIRALVALGRRLQGLGWLVGEHPAFGGVQGRHAPGGYHYSNQAVDVNWPMPGEELAKIKALLPMLGGTGGLGRVFEGLLRPRLKGPASVGLEAGQGALDRIWQAANASVENAVGGVGLEGMEGGFSGPWTQVMESIAKGKGWNLADWQRLVQKESGGNPAARNPSSGAFGLGQFLGSTAQAYAKYGALSPDGGDQIRAMAKYIEDRYGNPSKALAFHDANNWYSRGGLIGLATGGGIGKALRKVQFGKSKKIRGAAVAGLLDKVKGIGLPPDLQGDLKRLALDANTFGDYADRAGQMSVTNDDGSVIEGVVGGKTQVQWLTEQLTALFQWRNRIIDAEKVVVEKREETRALIEQARERLTEVRAEIQAAGKTRGRLAKRLDRVRGRLADLRKHPKKNAAKIAEFTNRATGLRASIATIDAAQAGRGRVRDALKDKILPALGEKRANLNTARGDLLSNLETVQGVGSPMGRLGALPEVGVLGGQIFDVQMRLRELTAEKPKVTDSSTPDDDPSKDALAQLLREANQRTAVSEAQYKVFKDFPFGGNFSQGGTVMGPPGAPRTIVAHGGERVLTRDEAETPIGATRVLVEDHRVRVWVDEVEQIVDSKMRRDGRSASRGLPGRGGGMLR